MLRLFWLLVAARLTMVTAGAVMLAGAWHKPLAEMPWGSIAPLLIAVAALSIAALLRLRSGRPIEEGTYLAHLMGDVATVTFALTMSDGIASTFFGFFVLPLMLAAYALTGARLVAALSIIALSMLLVSLANAGESAVGGMVLHEISERVAIVLAGITAYAMATLLRRHERDLLRVREAALSEQGFLALGAMALRTADTMGSPLATMSVLVHELRCRRLSPRYAGAALEELTRQIERCKCHLAELQASSGLGCPHGGTRWGIDELLKAAALQCEIMTPLLSVEMAAAHHPAPKVVDERALFDVLVLLIQHRGRHAPHRVRAELAWNERTIFVCLRGAAGPGTVAQEIAEPMVALAASLLGRRSGTVISEYLGDQRCFRIELPRTDMVSTSNPPGTESLAANHHQEKSP